MSVPDFQTTMRPLLEELKDGQVRVFNEVFEGVCRRLQLTDEERQVKIASGKQTVIKNRVSWARTYLTKAGLLTTPGKGLTQITKRGQEALAQTQQPIKVKYLKQFEEFKAFHESEKPKTTNHVKTQHDVDDHATPVDRLEAAHEELNDALADELLATVKLATPAFFEQLVVDLMLAMGYGGSKKEAGQATQYTADGGVDGVIKEDPLGLDTIYLQAKRYDDKTVGRPEVQAFAGALDMQRAKKGVFITTSKFSNDAEEFVRLIEKKIVLIDGERLVTLMIEHNLGVTTKDTYVIKQLDSAYFRDD